MAARVDFYVLSDAQPLAREHAACRLAEKAWRQNHRVFVHTASSTEARTIDNLMWTFRQNSFLPHELYQGESRALVPIMVGSGAEPDGESDVLINLTAQVPAFFTRFQRVAEFVGAGEPDRATGRDHYRIYREHGCVIESHNV